MNTYKNELLSVCLDVMYSILVEQPVLFPLVNTGHHAHFTVTFRATIAD